MARPLEGDKGSGPARSASAGRRGRRRVELDLEQSRPPLPGQEEDAASGVPGDAVEHVGARRPRRARAARRRRRSRSRGRSRGRCARSRRSSRRWRRARRRRPRARSGRRAPRRRGSRASVRATAKSPARRKTSRSLPSLWIRRSPSKARPQPSPVVAERCPAARSRPARQTCATPSRQVSWTSRSPTSASPSPNSRAPSATSRSTRPRRRARPRAGASRPSSPVDS